MSKEEIFHRMITIAPSMKEKIFYSAVLLFSSKGYQRVGIRELCHSVNIKESSFYNHYASKESLLQDIFSRFTQGSEKTLETNGEVEAIIESGDVEKYLEWNIMKFRSSTGDPLAYTIQQILMMESFTNPEAHEITRRAMYLARRGLLEDGLKRMQEKGFIKEECDIGQVVSEYYLGLKGLTDEYLFAELWKEDLEEIYRRIGAHVRFFANILKKQPGNG